MDRVTSDAASGGQIMTDAGRSRSQVTAGRIEFLATVLMAIAAIMTAWAAFQSTKWSGEQADNYSRAATARTESVRATTLTNRQVAIDVEVFLQWLQAFRDDTDSGAIAPLSGGGSDYEPTSGTLSGFLATRFRDEFRPAFDAWIATDPVTNPDSAETPFQHIEYSLASEQESQRLAEEAEVYTLIARSANERGDNYVLLTVLFAIGLFFAGVSGKLDRVTNSAIALCLSVVVVVAAAIVMVTYPVEI
jgi:hypothetical protein